MSAKNIFYAQSGGATAVINASACGLIETARQHSQLGKVYAGHNGIIGALNEELIDTSLESSEVIAALKYTPACAFGSCRYKLKNLDQDQSEYERLIQVFKAHDIGYFIYNGGGDSQDTTYKISKLSKQLQHPLICIGLPKTIDNDLPLTDNSPGFGSVAKYVAISTQEAALDVACMSASSTKIFILEVMGRHSGWIAAAAGLGAKQPGDAPHIILFPEVTFDRDKFLTSVKTNVEQHGYCVIVVSEGIRDARGEFLTKSSLHDAFGHEQLGGVAPMIAKMIYQTHGYKYHWAVADYLQRAARHIASHTDVEQAYALGQKAVECMLKQQSDIMLTIERLSSNPYRWQIGSAPLHAIANVEKKMPLEFIAEDGYGITEACREYLTPLVSGEAYPPYNDGLPRYARLQKHLVTKKLEVFAV